jgi:hypothetical protein
MAETTRQKAAQTAVDGFIIVERMYRHAYQTLMALKATLKTDLDLRTESALHSNPIVTADPRSWLHLFRWLYLAKTRVSLEGYKKKIVPVLFLQASLYNPDGEEPILRYGIVEKVFNMTTLKGARFDTYFRSTLAQLHVQRKSGKIRASNCEAEVRFDEKPLLDIREDGDIVALAAEIGQKYAKSLLG